MCITVKCEGGGGQSIWIRIFIFGLFKGSVGLFNAYLVVFGLFIPKTEKNHLKYL